MRLFASRSWSRLSERARWRVPFGLAGERGALLMEALVAVSVFTLLGTAVLSGTSTMYRALEDVEQAALAENVARNQIEVILAAPYQDPPHTYTPLSAPPGYAVTAEAQEVVAGDPNIARLVVTVSLHGEPAMTLESMRSKAP